MAKPVVDELAKIMAATSRQMGMGKRKILGVTITLGVPESEFREFLENPEGYIKAFEMLDANQEFAKQKRVTGGDVIAVAKLLCVVSKFYSETVCPFLP